MYPQTFQAEKFNQRVRNVGLFYPQVHFISCVVSVDLYHSNKYIERRIETYCAHHVHKNKYLSVFPRRYLPECKYDTP